MTEGSPVEMLAHRMARKRLSAVERVIGLIGSLSALGLAVAYVVNNGHL